MNKIEEGSCYLLPEGEWAITIREKIIDGRKCFIKNEEKFLMEGGYIHVWEVGNDYARGRYINPGLKAGGTWAPSGTDIEIPLGKCGGLIKVDPANGLEIIGLNKPANELLKSAIGTYKKFLEAQNNRKRSISTDTPPSLELANFLMLMAVYRQNERLIALFEKEGE